MGSGAIESAANGGDGMTTNYWKRQVPPLDLPPVDFEKAIRDYAAKHNIPLEDMIDEYKKVAIYRQVESYIKTALEDTES